MADILSVHSTPLEMEILPAHAGRVRALRISGENLLTGPETHPENWGATYWTSPQADWGWPPVPEVDSHPYEVLTEGPAVSLKSRVAEFGGRRLTILKRYQPAQDGAIDTEYVIENCGTTEFQMASWEISRVPAGGLTFYPTGDAEQTPIAPHSELTTEKASGTTFYDHAGFEAGKCRKLHADGKGGYLAHLQGRHLMLKLFEDSTPKEQAPGEGECEIFANDDGKYVEVEVQSRYARISPGESFSFLVRTVVMTLPEGLSPKDRSALRRFADEKAVFHWK